MRTMVKEMISVTLLIAILASFSFVSIVGNAEIAATLSVGTTTGTPGETVDVPISIATNPGIATFGLLLNYDSNSLTPLSCTAGSVWKGSIIFNPNYSANKVLLAGSSSSNYNGDGTILVVKFQIKADAVTSSLNVTVDELESISGASGIAIANTIVDGSVIVKAGTSTPVGNVLFQRVIAPIANPPSGAVTSGTQISLSSTTDGAAIYYTTNGTIPTVASSLYTAPITIDSTIVINAVAKKQGMEDSQLLTASYTITENDVPVSLTSPVSMPISTASPTPIPQTLRFEDLSKYDWAKEAINALADIGIIKGTSEKTFSPERQVTRADYLLVMVRMLDLKANVVDNFDDVTIDKYYYHEIGVAKALGLTTGIGDNKYNPEEPISRQDMFVLASRMMKKLNKLNTQGALSVLNQYADSSEVSEYAKADFAILLNLGFIKGNNNYLNPKHNAARAETAVFAFRIYNFLNK